MVCAPRCPLCREQLQGPFRVNHVLGDMIALLQIQSPMKPSPSFKSSRGFGKPWQEKEAPRGNSRPQLPNLSSPRQPLQQLSDQPPPRHAEAQPRAGLALAEIRPPSPRLALASWLPAIVPSVPQALVPIQYTRRVPTEVPTLEQAVRDAMPGTLVLMARGTHTLSAPLVICKQARASCAPWRGGANPHLSPSPSPSPHLSPSPSPHPHPSAHPHSRPHPTRAPGQVRIKGEGSASECQLLCSGGCGIMVDRGGYALISALTIHHVRARRGAEPGEAPPTGMACAVRVSGAGSRLLLDHCEVRADGVGVAATDDSRLDLQFTRVHDCKAHAVCVQSNAKACVEECCLESNAGSGIHADGASLEARRNTVCHNMHSGAQLLGRCCGSIKYNKMYENRRKNVALSRVPWWARGSIKVHSNMR